MAAVYRALLDAVSAVAVSFSSAMQLSAVAMMAAFWSSSAIE